jgi:hypothetical protein
MAAARQQDRRRTRAARAVGHSPWSGSTEDLVIFWGLRMTSTKFAANRRQCPHVPSASAARQLGSACSRRNRSDGPSISRRIAAGAFRPRKLTNASDFITRPSPGPQGGLRRSPIRGVGGEAVAANHVAGLSVETTERHCCGTVEGRWPSSGPAPPASSPLRGPIPAAPMNVITSE